jgi:hypothetical protein
MTPDKLRCLPVDLGKLPAIDHAKRKLALAMILPAITVDRMARNCAAQDNDSGDVAAIAAGRHPKQARGGFRS